MNLHLLAVKELIAVQLFSPLGYLSPAAGASLRLPEKPRAQRRLQGKGASLFSFKSKICSILPLSSFHVTSKRPSFISKTIPMPWHSSDDTSRGPPELKRSYLNPISQNPGDPKDPTGSWT